MFTLSVSFEMTDAGDARKDEDATSFDATSVGTVFGSLVEAPSMFDGDDDTCAHLGSIVGASLLFFARSTSSPKGGGEDEEEEEEE